MTNVPSHLLFQDSTETQLEGKTHCLPQGHQPSPISCESWIASRHWQILQGFHVVVLQLRSAVNRLLKRYTLLLFLCPPSVFFSSLANLLRKCSRTHKNKQEQNQQTHTLTRTNSNIHTHTHTHTLSLSFSFSLFALVSQQYERRLGTLCEIYSFQFNKLERRRRSMIGRDREDPPV